MKRRGTSIEGLLNKFRDGGTSGPLLGQGGYLLLSGNLSSDEKPEESLWEGFGAAWSSGEKFLAFWDSLATEANSLL